MTLDKKHLVSCWVFASLKDFFISFEFEDRNIWHEYSTYFCHQGLEKICKAYLIASRWEDENFQNLNKVNDFVKKELSHNLSKMIKKLEGINILPRGADTRRVEGHTEAELIKVLMASYAEARYPVPRRSSEDFPIDERLNLYHNPIGETAPIRYARNSAQAIIQKIEQDFSITIEPNSAYISRKIDEEQWNRFRRLFFKTND